MPLVSSCPKCDAPVLVPDGVDPSAKAKCPMCEAQFELQEALSDLPPLLEILEQPNRPARPLVAAAPAALPADEVGGDALTPLGDAEFGTEQASDGDAMFANYSDGDGADGAALGNGDDMFAVEESAPAEDGDIGGGFGSIDFGNGEMGDADGDTQQPEGGAFDTATAAAPASLAGKARPKKKKGPGPLVQVAGIAGFGVLGLMIGYVILVMIKGSAGDFLKIGKYMPSFIYDAKEDSGNGEPKIVVKESPKKKGRKKSKDGDDDSELPVTRFNEGDVGKDNGKKTDGDDDDDDATPRLVGPTGLEITDEDDIVTALNEVEAKAAEILVADDKGSKAFKRLQVDHYVALGNVGLTLAGAPKDARTPKLNKRITDYVHHAIESVDSLDGIGQKAKIWINYKRVEQSVADDEGTVEIVVKKKGREGKDGVLIAGDVKSAHAIENKKRFFSAVVRFAGVDGSVPVIGRGKPPANGPILLLGTIVEKPDEDLADFGPYEGDEEAVVWMSMRIDLPGEDEPNDDPFGERNNGEDKGPADRIESADNPRSPFDEPDLPTIPKLKPPAIDLPGPGIPEPVVDLVDPEESDTIEAK